MAKLCAQLIVWNWIYLDDGWPALAVRWVRITWSDKKEPHAFPLRTAELTHFPDRNCNHFCSFSSVQGCVRGVRSCVAFSNCFMSAIRIINYFVWKVRWILDQISSVCEWYSIEQRPQCHTKIARKIERDWPRRKIADLFSASSHSIVDPPQLANNTNYVS